MEGVPSGAATYWCFSADRMLVGLKVASERGSAPETPARVVQPSLPLVDCATGIRAARSWVPARLVALPVVLDDLEVDVDLDPDAVLVEEDFLVVLVFFLEEVALASLTAAGDASAFALVWVSADAVLQEGVRRMRLWLAGMGPAATRVAKTKKRATRVLIESMATNREGKDR